MSNLICSNPPTREGIVGDINPINNWNKLNMLVFQVLKVEFCLQSQATFPRRIFQPAIITLYRTWQCRITARTFYLKCLNDTKSLNVVQYVLDLCTVNVTVITSSAYKEGYAFLFVSYDHPDDWLTRTRCSTVYLPVNRCGDLLLCGELQGVDNSKQLIKVPSRGGRVEDGQLQLLVGANHKHLKGVKMTQDQHNTQIISLFF